MRRILRLLVFLPNPTLPLDGQFLGIPSKNKKKKTHDEQLRNWELVRTSKGRICRPKAQYSILSGLAAHTRNPASASSRIIWIVGMRRSRWGLFNSV